MVRICVTNKLIKYYISWLLGSPSFLLFSSPRVLLTTEAMWSLILLLLCWEISLLLLLCFIYGWGKCRCILEIAKWVLEPSTWSSRTTLELECWSHGSSICIWDIRLGTRRCLLVERLWWSWSTCSSHSSLESRGWLLWYRSPTSYCLNFLNLQVLNRFFLGFLTESFVFFIHIQN